MCTIYGNNKNSIVLTFFLNKDYIRNLMHKICKSSFYEYGYHRDKFKMCTILIFKTNSNY